ncbi:MAG: T9SS type A sorting domain-containing protein [Rufibacter sp.]
MLLLLATTSFSPSFSVALGSNKPTIDFPYGNRSGTGIGLEKAALYFSSTITGFSPEVAAKGHIITITGTGFPSDGSVKFTGTGGTTVTAEIVANTFSETSVKVYVPENAVTGPIIYVDNTGTTLASSGTVFTLAPTYTWNNTSSNWSLSSSWTPERTSPGANDVLVFDGGTVAVTLGTSETISQLKFLSNVQATITTNGTNTLSINGSTAQGLEGTDFFIANSASVTITNAAAGNLNIELGGVETADIHGSLTFTGSTSPAHTLKGTTESSIFFVSGSSFTTGESYTANPFNTSGTNLVTFSAGSTYKVLGAHDPSALGTAVNFADGVNFELSGSTETVPSLTYKNLTVSGTGNKTLAGGITVNGTLTLSGGHLLTGSNAVVLGEDAQVVGESSAHYIVGVVQTTREVNGANDFGGIGFEITSGPAMGSTTVVRTSGLAGAITKDDNTGIKRNWNVSPTTQPASPVAISLSWPAADDNEKDLKTLRIYKTQTVNNTTKYVDVSQADIDLSGTSSDIRTVTGTVSSFSILTVSDKTNPLPVTLKSFTAKRHGNYAILTWQTASEQNNAGFDIEVSSDARQFEKIGFVPAPAPNSSTLKKYQFLDTRLEKSGILYYRLKQIDIDGQSAYHGLQSVSFKGNITATTVSPNPVTNGLKVFFQADKTQLVTVKVTDALGKLVLQKQVQAQDGTNETELTLNQAIPAGLYVLSLFSENGQENVRIVKE